MTRHVSRHTAGFHDAELTVQRQAGVRAQAGRPAGMLEQPDLRGGAARFLADRSFATRLNRRRSTSAIIRKSSGVSPLRMRNRRYSFGSGRPSMKTTMLPTALVPWMLLMS